MLKPALTFVVFLALISGSSAQGWEHHVCEAGDMDYVPGHGIELQSRTEGYVLDVMISDKDWYDSSRLGNDGKDWLKAGGVSYLSIWRLGTWAKNHLSALVGFRMTADHTYEVCAYVNDEDGGRRTDGITRLKTGERVTITYRYREAEQTAEYTILTKDSEQTYTFPEFEVASRQLNVGPWHGGTSPAPVETGINTSFRLLYEEGVKE